VRFWLKASERRPNPAPVQTDDRKAFFAGTALWVLGLVAVLVFLPALSAADHAWWLWTCVAGLAIGLIGIFYSFWRQRQRD
jgi:hypothetical protein